MKNIIYRRFSVAIFSIVLTLAASLTAFGAATITIVNGDPAGVGFNDATIVAPVGGNPGTTVGQQRLNAFQAAANKWGATLSSVVTIRVLATWEALGCTATGAVLGSAGAIEVFRDFTGAAFPGTWYGKAQANALFGAELSANADIRARFNVNLGQPGCLTGIFFYLGLDNNHGANVDLVTVLEHEFAHGLGFQTFTNGSSGAQFQGLPSIWDRFLLDNTTATTWNAMTDAQRTASAINNNLVWNGASVTGTVPYVLGNPVLKINSPAGIAASYPVGFASFGRRLNFAVVNADLVLGIDGTAPVNDGCEPLTNGAALAGKIAVIDRGLCSLTVKVKNAQNAGAIGAIIVNNVTGPATGMAGTDLTITIPSVMVSQADGNAIKAQLPGVNGSLKLDSSIKPGADPSGKARMYAPNAFQGGSSVSHWDTSAFLNQLMEPGINSDLTHEVIAPWDLTYALLKDIGWQGGPPPSNAAVNLSVSSSTGIETGQTAVTVTATASSAVLGDQSVSLAVTGTGITAGDYSLSANTIVILNGQTTGTATFTVKDDLLNEGNETASLTISDPSVGLTLGATLSQNVTITDSDNAGAANFGLPSPGAFRVVRNAGNFEIYNSLNVLIASGPIDGGPWVINGTSGNDTLTVDLNGGPFPSAITFNGGDPTFGPGDKLNIIGGNQGLVTYNYTNAHDGSIVMENSGTVNYTGLEPIANSGTASDVVFNLPAVPNAATLADLGGGLSRLSGATFETTDFTNPTGSVTVNRGHAADTLTVNALAANYPSLNIGTALAPFDHVTFAGALAMASGKNLTVFAARQISLSTAASNISAAGSGTISMTTASNILANPGSSMTVVNGNLTLNANQQAGPSPTAGYFYAVNVFGAVVETSGTGNILINGRGGSDVTPGGVVTAGVVVQGVGQIRSIGAGPTAGGITINGVGGSTGAAFTDGVAVADTAGITSISGDISITGTGGTSAGTTSYNSIGLDLQGSGFIRSTGTGTDAASITIIANGGTVVAGASAGFVMFILPNLSTVDGPVNITGQGGVGSVPVGNLASIGVLVQSGSNISSSGAGAGTGTITIAGTGANVVSGASQGFRNEGVLATVNSNVTLIGTGGNGSLTNNGSSIRGNVIATGTANISITGTIGTGAVAGPNHGVNVRSGAAVSVASGALTITGTGGNTADNAGFNLAPATLGTGSLNTTAPGGSITVNADTISIDTANGTISAPNNVVTLRQKTNGVAINLGSAVDSTPGTLELSDAELDRITAGTVFIGNANSGAISVTNVISPLNYKTLSLQKGVAFTSTGGFDSEVTSASVYEKMQAAGAVTVAPAATLAATAIGGFVPVNGNSFTMVENTTGTGTTGTFSGKPEGSSLTLGGANAIITYVGGPGTNDVIIGVDTAAPKVSSTVPAEAAIGVLTNSNITINFNEKVNIGAGGITLNCGGVQTFAPTLPQNGVTSIVVDPTNILPAGVLCTVTGVSANIKDLAGNQLDGDGNNVGGDNFALTFTTACTNPTVVTTNGDTGPGSLRDAVLNACPGSTITFNIGAGFVVSPVTLTSGEIAIDKNLTISGPGASLLTISGNNNSRIFSVGAFAFNLNGLTLTNGNGVGSTASGVGGAIYNRSGIVVITSSILTGNSATGGGGVYNRGGTMTISNSTISGNTAFLGGGVQNVRFAGDGDTALTITNSTISSNSAEFGAGIHNQGASLIVNNSTVSGNTANGSDPTGSGGGLENVASSFDATATLTSCTFFGNRQTSSADPTGDEIYSGNFGFQSTVILRNTIVGGSPATATPNLRVFTDGTIPALGTITSNGFNLSTDNGSGFLAAPTDQINTDPRLAPLANNGGPTQTHALCVAAGVPHASCTGLSPAIDKGKDFALTGFDQRGSGPNFIRPFDLPDAAFPDAAGGDGSDIGAYELNNTPPTINTVLGLIRQRGTPASNSTIANVTDIESGNGSVVVTVNGGAAATVNGVTVSNIVNTNGTITADVVADCTATAALFTLTATDNGGLTDTASFGVLALPNTAPALTYSSQTMTAGTTLSFGPATGPSDNGTVGAVTLQSVTPNTGLAGNVDPAGQVNITGAPTVGVYTVVVSVTDNCGAATTAVVTVNVTCPTITVGPASLANGTATAPYSQTITAGPAGGNYTFAVTSGALPAGLTLNPTSGLLSGTPTANGTFNFRITATGFGGCSGWRDYTVTIAKADTVTTVVSSQPTSTFGEAVTFTATVTPSAPATGIPTGTMNFLDNGNPIAACQAVGLNEAGQAACPASTLTAGTHTISAVYSGSGVYNTSTGTTSQTIDRRVLTITAEDKTRVFGAPNPALTFLITGFVNGETFATSGVAGAPSVTTAATQVIPVGSYPIAAALGALTSANYSFTFVPGTLTVTQAATTTTITNAAALAATPTTIGQAYAVNWQTSPVAPSTGVPTGTVTVTDGTDTCTAAVGALTCNLTSTTFGPKNITATYGGDSNMTGSTSAAVSHAVHIGITGNVKQFGTNANLAGVTITLSGSAAAVAVTDANGNYGFGVPVSGGSYVLTPSGLSKTYEPILRSYTNVTANITNADFTAYDILGAGANPRHVRVQNTVTTGGEAAVVPVMMVSRGNEVKIAFSLAYDMAVMGTPTVACGYDTAGCSLTVNTSQPGRLGITLTPAAVLTPGLKEIVKVTFQTVANTLTSTPVSFDDIPTVRDIRNAEGNPLPAIYNTGFVTFTQNSLGLEGDVVDANGDPAGGDGVKANDVTVISQRVTSPNTTPPFATTPNQFQRADVNVPCGNGGIDAGDVTVITQLALGIIAPIGACGPATPTGSTSRPEDSEGTARIIRAVNTTAVAGGTVTVSFVIVSQGNEASASYSVTFPQGTLTNPQVAAGSGVPSGTTVLTNSEAAQGRIGVLIATPNSYTAGTRQMITITFNVSAQATAGTYPIGFSSTPVGQNVSAAAGGALLPTTYEPGNVVIGPTAAGVEVSGKVQTADGRGLRNATVTITDAEGNRRTATTGSFGSYRFDDIEAGKTYVIAVTSQRFRFASRTVNVTDSLTDVDFNGQE